MDLSKNLHNSAHWLSDAPLSLGNQRVPLPHLLAGHIRDSPQHYGSGVTFEAESLRKTNQQGMRLTRPPERLRYRTLKIK